MEARLTIHDDDANKTILYETIWPLVKGESITVDAKATMATAVADLVERAQPAVDAQPPAK